MNKVVSLVAVLMFATSAKSADHLLPEQSLFTGIFWEESYSLFASRLRRMYGRDAFANVVVLPSFEREFVIVLEEQAGDYSLVCMQTNTSLANYQYLNMYRSGELRLGTDEETRAEIERLEAELPQDFMEIEAEVTEIALAQTVGEQLYSIWGTMLYGTKYPTPVDLSSDSYATFSPGNDGTTYHFSFFHGGTPLSGWIWDYQGKELLENFIAVVSTLKQRCEPEASDDGSSLEEKVNEVHSRLQYKGE